MKGSTYYDMGEIDIAWCPGCGNYMILDVLKEALIELDLRPQDVVLVSGIGQAAKIPHYLRCNFFNGLHGRALPPATAIKAANPRLTVIAESGDGDTYGEGGNHFIHTIRRNPRIVNIVHDNMVYGLTKGQASPTSRIGFETSIRVGGVRNEPFNPLSVAIALKASFVARAYCADKVGFKEIVKKAVAHHGYSLIDVFQPCVSYNKLNTYKWFQEHTYTLSDDHDPTDRVQAFARAMEEDPLPLGIFYLSDERPTFEDNILAYEDDNGSIVDRNVDIAGEIRKLLATYR